MTYVKIKFLEFYLNGKCAFSRVKLYLLSFSKICLIVIGLLSMRRWFPIFAI